MKRSQSSTPLPRSKILDLYFLEHRAKLVDIAAFLDRLDRSGEEEPQEDFRLTAFRQALEILLDPVCCRTGRVLKVFSDPTHEPIASAEGLKGAYGAYPGEMES